MEINRQSSADDIAQWMLRQKFDHEAVQEIRQKQILDHELMTLHDDVWHSRVLASLSVGEKFDLLEQIEIFQLLYEIECLVDRVETVSG
tara:strand:+ start:313 stop:579 length:267 start_codon:yes stop_codon:yes gene_type:complete